MVFQCATCLSIVGDSLAWVQADESVGTITLSAMRGVKPQLENSRTSTAGKDKNWCVGPSSIVIDHYRALTLALITRTILNADNTICFADSPGARSVYAPVVCKGTLPAQGKEKARECGAELGKMYTATSEPFDAVRCVRSPTLTT